MTERSPQFLSALAALAQESNVSLFDLTDMADEICIGLSGYQQEREATTLEILKDMEHYPMTGQWK